MSAAIDYLPIWKKDASAEERFLELAMIAKKHPERFGRIVVVYQETLPNGRTKLRYIGDDETTTNELLGLLAVAQMQVYEETSR